MRITTEDSWAGSISLQSLGCIDNLKETVLEMRELLRAVECINIAVAEIDANFEMFKYCDANKKLKSGFNQVARNALLQLLRFESQFDRALLKELILEVQKVESSVNRLELDLKLSRRQKWLCQVTLQVESETANTRLTLDDSYYFKPFDEAQAQSTEK